MTDGVLGREVIPGRVAAFDSSGRFVVELLAGSVGIRVPGWVMVNPDQASPLSLVGQIFEVACEHPGRISVSGELLEDCGAAGRRLAGLFKGRRVTRFAVDESGFVPLHHDLLDLEGVDCVGPGK